MNTQGFGVEFADKKSSLNKALASKADKEDLEKLHEMKTNKEDTENMMDLLATLNNQIRHIIVLLNEGLKLNIMKA